MITILNENDLEQVMKIWLESNITAHHFIPATYWKSLYTMVSTMLPKAEVYVAKEKQAVIGFIGVNQQHIEGIFIDQKYQSHGYGQQLLDFIKAKHNHLSLCVYQKNLRAINFYQRTGFKTVKQSVDENTGEIEMHMHWRRGE